MKASAITNYSLIIQKMLETYIEQNLRSFRMHIEHQIELVYHDYHIQALQREYEFIMEMDGDFSHNPEDIPKFLEAAKTACIGWGLPRRTASAAITCALLGAPGAA